MKAIKHIQNNILSGLQMEKDSLQMRCDQAAAAAVCTRPTQAQASQTASGMEEGLTKRHPSRGAPGSWATGEGSIGVLQADSPPPLRWVPRSGGCPTPMHILPAPAGLMLKQTNKLTN